MASETTFYSRFDISALMALINMLKANLIDHPEIYRTLLAMMEDYDSADAIRRHKIVRYLKLMITDQMLLRCILMSLPEASPTNRSIPLQKPLATPEKILLPPRMQQNFMRSRKLRYGSGFNFKSVTQSQLLPTSKKLFHSTSATESTFGDFSQDIPVNAPSTSTQEDVLNDSKETTHDTFVPIDDFHQRELIDGTSTSTAKDSESQIFDSKKRSPRILQTPDNPKKRRSHIACTSSCQQVQGQFGHQGFIPPNASLPIQYQSLPFTQAYPGFYEYPDRMTVRPLLPWQPLNIYQSTGPFHQIPPTSFHQGDFLSYNDPLSGIDPTLASIKQEYESKLYIESDLLKQQTAAPMSSRRFMSVDDLPKNQDISKVSGMRKSVTKSQSSSQASVCKASSMLAMNVSMSSKKNVSNLEALADLVSSFSHENQPSTDTQIYNGLRNTDSRGISQIKSKKQMAYPIISQRSPVFLNAQCASPIVGQSLASMEKVTGSSNQLENREEGNMLMKSFPYGQEIKLSDGRYLIFNSSATEKKIINVKSDQKPLSHWSSMRPSKTVFESTDYLKKQSGSSKFSGNADPSNTLLNKINNTSGNAGSQGNSTYGARKRQDQQTDTKQDSQSELKCTLPSTSSDEKKCTIHIHNTATNKLITQLLRKRALSDCTEGCNTPIEKKVRAMSDSVLPTSTGSNLKPNVSENGNTSSVVNGEMPLHLGIDGLPISHADANGVTFVSSDVHGVNVIPLDVHCVPTFPTNGNTSLPTDVNAVTAFPSVTNAKFSDDNKQDMQTVISDTNVRPAKPKVTQGAIQDFDKGKDLPQNTGKLIDALPIIPDAGMSATMASNLDAQSNGTLTEKSNGAIYRKDDDVSDSTVTKKDIEPHSIQRSRSDCMLTDEIPWQVGNAGDCQHPLRDVKSSCYRTHTSSSSEPISIRTFSTDDGNDSGNEEFYDSVFIS